MHLATTSSSRPLDQRAERSSSKFGSRRGECSESKAESRLRYWLSVHFTAAAVICFTLAFFTACGPTSGADAVATSSDALVTVDPTRELVINDLSVVEDPLRTAWVARPADHDGGAWSFGGLMARMAGRHSASKFVLELLKTWETDQVVNQFVVPARPKIRTLVTNPWREISGCAVDDSPCTLDFGKAPFRLLAIVNRLDLRTFASGRGGNAGQGRFVFGVLGSDGSKLQFTVILEYALLARERDDILDWAQLWHSLGRRPFGHQYNQQLRHITDRFAGRNVARGRPNGSALLQLRTNEVSLSSSKPMLWELREFTISATTGYLEQVTVKQTPDISFNNSQALADFINSNATAIMNNQSDLPSSMVGGSAPNPGLPAPSSEDFVWTAPGVDESLRHQFAAQTCNGCHLSETGTRFTHVKPRNAGVPADLSDFLQQTAIPFRTDDLITVLTQRDDNDHDERSEHRH